MKIKFNLILVLLLFFSFFSYSSLSRDLGNKIGFTESYDNQLFFWAKYLAEEKSLVYNNPLNEKYDPQIFVARDYIQEGSMTKKF